MKAKKPAAVRRWVPSANAPEYVCYSEGIVSIPNNLRTMRDGLARFGEEIAKLTSLRGIVSLRKNRTGTRLRVFHADKARRAVA